MTINSITSRDRLYFSPIETPLANLTVKHFTTTSASALGRHGVPATVVPLNYTLDGSMSAPLRAVLEQYLATDDVLSAEWLHTLVLVSGNTDGPAGVPQIDSKTLKMVAREYETRNISIHPTLRAVDSARTQALS